MRILVVGAGATGGFFGIRLAAAGRDVTFLARPKRAEQLREHGLRLLGPDGAEQDKISAVVVTADQISEPYDLVLLAVKSGGIAQALVDMAPAVGPQTAIVPFLNGMRHLDELSAEFGVQRVLGGAIKVVTTLNPEGDIVQLAPLRTIRIGELDAAPSERVDRILAEFDGAGLDMGAAQDIVAAMWHKWVFISAIGALTCLMRGSVGEITAQPGGTSLALLILAEASAVSEAAGYPLPRSEIDFATANLTQKGSPLASSMYRDLAAGLPLESDQILGDLTIRARELGVPTPTIDLAALQLRIYQARVTGSAA